VFPLAPKSKIPAIAKVDGGHGVLDATTDIDVICGWWTTMPTANIGGAVPAGLVVLDVDPRHQGDVRLAEIEDIHGRLPITLTCVSGRGDGGRHYYFRHPGGKLTTRRLPTGIDLKGAGGYAVLPPSIHPDSGEPYTWVDPDIPPAPMPGWLVDLLRLEPVVIVTKPVRSRLLSDGESPADWYTRTTTWPEVLIPHGWVPVGGDVGCWRHPTATSPMLATVTNDVLFVYSNNTPFEPTTAGVPQLDNGDPLTVGDPLTDSPAR
jgi:hypothetical protein